MNNSFYNKLQKLLEIENPFFDELYSLLQCKEIQKNDFVLQENDTCKFIGLLEEGSMRTFYINEKGEDVSFLFHFNQQIEDLFFTDYESVLLGTKTKLNIQALENSKVHFITKEDWNNLCNKNVFWQYFSKKMTEKIYLSAKKRVEHLLYYTPENRYLKLLEENPHIFQKIPQKYIASYIGITPQSLSRIRNRIN